MTASNALLLTCSVCALAFQWWWFVRRSDEQMKARLDAVEGQRKQERAGRVSAERELRETYRQKLDTKGGYFVQPIATIHSCFKNCLGTPRQGFLAPGKCAAVIG